MPAARPEIGHRLLVAAGVAAALGSVAIDHLLPGSRPGLGTSQLFVLVFGAALAVVGAACGFPRVAAQAATLFALGAALVAAVAGAPRSGWLWGAAGAAVAGAALAAPGPAGRALRGQLPSWRKVGSRSAGYFALNVLQVGLAAVIIAAFHIESQAFYETVTAMIVAGFLLRQLVPAETRLTFFAALSVFGLVVVLGARYALVVGAVSAALLGAAHLPLSFRARVGLLFALAALLVVWRAQLVPGPVPAAVWPILGSMFMFRLIIYMYDQSHLKEKLSWSRVIAYFFMLPNVVFPFFPVVDFATFRRTHDDTEPNRIYAKGVSFLFWGLLHLLLYRWVSYHLMLAPEQVTGVRDLGRYLLANFLLYLRVSGQFHLIVGLLHLFGFNLPETHKQYFLAAGFTDLWRRINIYWKDFMLKVFYYPILFRLKRLGPIRSMVVATMLVFLLTWVFHGYQWFWLRGTWLWSLPDMLFWGLLGLLVVVNSVIEMRRGRRRSLSGRAVPWRERWGPALAVGGTFFTMMVLWSLWSSPTLSAWFGLWGALRPAAAHAAAGLGAAALGFLALAAAGRPPASKLAAANAAAAAGRGTSPPTGIPAAPGRAGFDRLALAGLLLLAALGQPALVDRLPSPAAPVLQGLRWARLNPRDAAQMEHGYYEGLNAVNNFNGELWQVYMHRPNAVPIWETDAARDTHDYLRMELNPNVSIVFRGKPYQTNRWGMRDRDYEREKPPNVIRVALIGDSHSEGWGVAAEENFESRLEDRLAREPLWSGMRKIELLNFSVGGYNPIQEMLALERKALTFHPDVVYVIGHPGEKERALAHFWWAATVDQPCPFPELAPLVAKAHLTRKTDMTDAIRRLAPDADSIMTWTYRRMVTACRSQGVTPYWILIPAGTDQVRPPDLEHQLEIVRAVGFTVVDLFDVYAGHDPKELAVAEWDQHPNALGHQLIADRFYQVLQQRPELLGPGAQYPPPSPPPRP